MSLFHLAALATMLQAAEVDCTTDPRAAGVAENARALRTAVGAPEINVPARPTDDTYLDGHNTDAFLEAHPYSRFKTRFIDARDARLGRASGTPSLTIGAVNCDEVIAKAITLTGTSFEELSLRARGTPHYGSYNKREAAPEWRGINGVFMRTSSEGFIDRKFTYAEGESAKTRAAAGGELRRLLLSDNAEVRRRRLTHQQLADPVLTAIESYALRGQTEFTYGGQTYAVHQKSMGGAVDLLRRDDTPETLRRRASGWTGRGVQGSPFNDELFSNSLFVIKNAAGAEFTIDGLSPHLIHRYGFYQGGPYRTDPAALQRFFDVKPSAADPWAACQR